MSNLSASSSSPPSGLKGSSSSAALGSSGTQPIKFCITDSYQVMSEKTNSSWQKNSNLRDNARLLHKHTQKLYEHSLEQTAIEGQLSESYTNYSVGVEDQTSAFGELMRKFGETLKDTGTTRQKMLDHVSKDFLQPLSNCIEYDFGQVRHARDKVKKSVKDYDVALDQFQSVFRDGNLLNRNKLTQLEKELGQLHEVIVQNTNDFFEKTTTLERKKDTKVMRTLLSGMKAYCDFYQKTAELYARIAPQIESFEKQLSDLEKGTHVKPTKEGHLLAKRSKGWNKEYFELRDGLLYKISKSDKTIDPENSISMQLSTVKLGPPKDTKQDKGKEKLCFQVINPLQKKPLVLQAATVEERDEWVAVLEQAISTYLDLGDANSQRSDDNPIAEKILRIVRTIPGNTVCCDCATESPTWVSINLGMVMCLECSGVHRSLGSHISKVRSLTLDKWDPEMIVYLAMIGNTKGNEFFLKEMPEDYQKLNPKSDRTSRERLITAKYKDRLFLPTNLEEYMVTKESLDTTDEKENFAGVFKLLVFLFCNKETNFDLLSGSTLLIESAKSNNWLYIQALIACGVNLYSQDASGRTAFHYAAEANFFQSLNVLCRAASKDLDPNRFRDLKGETPLEIALAKGNLESAALLSGRVAALSPQDPSYMTVLNKMLEISEQQYQQTSLDGHEAVPEGQASASASASVGAGAEEEKMNGKTVPNCIVDQYAIVVETLNKNLVDSLHSYPLDLMFDDVLDFGDSLDGPSSSSEASLSEGDIHRSLQTSSSTGAISTSPGSTETLKKLDFLAPPHEADNPLASNSWSSSTTKAFLNLRPVLSPHMSNSNLTANPHRHSFSPSSGVSSRSHSVDETNKPIRRRRTQTSTLSDSLFDSGSEPRPSLEVDSIDSSSGGDSGEEGDSSSVSPTITKQKRVKTHSFNSMPNKDSIGPDGDSAAPGMVMDQMAVWRRSSNETPVDPNAPSDDGKKNKFAFVKRLATRKSEEKKIKRKSLLPGTPALFASTGSSAAASSTSAISSSSGAFSKPPLTTQTSAVENYDHLDPEYLINTSSFKVLASITNNSLISSSSGPGNHGSSASGATTKRQTSGIECFGSALTSANVLPRSAESSFVETDWFLPDRFVEIAGDFEIPLDGPPSPPPISPRVTPPHTSPRIPPPTPPRPNISSPSSPDQQ